MKFEELKGKTIKSITISDDKGCMNFNCDNEEYRLIYHPDCCATCTIEDICGDLEDLIGNPLLMAELITHENKNPDGVKIPDEQDSFTWSFYKLATIKGSVTIRWYGESNSYYSEEVTFEKLIDGEWKE